MDNFPEENYEEVFYISVNPLCIDLKRKAIDNKLIFCQLLRDILWAFSSEAIPGFYSIYLNNKVIPIGNIPSLPRTDNTSDFIKHENELMNLLGNELDEHFSNLLKDSSDGSMDDLMSSLKQNLIKDEPGLPKYILNVFDLICHTDSENDEHTWEYKFLEAKKLLNDSYKELSNPGYEEEEFAHTYVIGSNYLKREELIFYVYEDDFCAGYFSHEDNQIDHTLNNEECWSDPSSHNFINPKLLDKLNSKFWKTQPTPWKNF